MSSPYRSFNLSKLPDAPTTEVIKIAGWVASVRTHAKVIFFNLQDGTGSVQCIAKAQNDPQLFSDLHTLKASDLLSLEGIPQTRSPNFIVPGPLGHLEFVVSGWQLLQRPRVTLDPKASLKEGTRFHYRYLDLRNPASIAPIKFRSWLIKCAHHFFDQADFLYIDTPMLTSSCLLYTSPSPRD